MCFNQSPCAQKQNQKVECEREEDLDNGLHPMLVKRIVEENWDEQNRGKNPKEAQSSAIRPPKIDDGQRPRGVRTQILSAVVAPFQRVREIPFERLHHVTIACICEKSRDLG